MKRLSALLVCLLLLFAVFGSAQAQELPYTDSGAIRNADAVAMLTDLGLLEGSDDGAFHPEGILTRAEVAKLAALIISPEPAATEEVPFPDAERSWAADYIAFCYERGFVAGYDDGSFAPNEPVTARELVKMLLGAIGYDLSGMEGAGWDAELDALADALAVYNGYDPDPGKVIRRDAAARLILNVLNCNAIAGYEDGEPVVLTDDLLNPVSVLEHRFGVTRYRQTITANEYADLDNPGEHLDAGVTKLYGHYPMGFSSSWSDLGRTVTVYLRDGQVVGVPVFDPAEFCVTVGGATLDTVLRQGGYTLGADTRIYLDAVQAGTEVLATLDENDTVTLIDYESDGEIDLVLVFRWQRCAVLQNAPLVIETGSGSEVFPGQTAGGADEVLARKMGGVWVTTNVRGS